MEWTGYGTGGMGEKREWSNEQDEAWGPLGAYASNCNISLGCTKNAQYYNWILLAKVKVGR